MFSDTERRFPCWLIVVSKDKEVSYLHKSSETPANPDSGDTKVWSFMIKVINIYVNSSTFSCSGFLCCYTVSRKIISSWSITSTLNGWCWKDPWILVIYLILLSQYIQTVSQATMAFASLRFILSSVTCAVVESRMSTLSKR